MTAAVVAVVHLTLAAGHLSDLLRGDLAPVHVGKGFGALAGAYVFAALATRTLATRALATRALATRTLATRAGQPGGGHH